jgi:hypothetical protein
VKFRTKYLWAAFGQGSFLACEWPYLQEFRKRVIPDEISGKSGEIYEEILEIRSCIGIKRAWGESNSPREHLK